MRNQTRQGTAVGGAGGWMILVAILALVLSACGNGSGSEVEESASGSGEEQPEEEEEPVEAPSEEPAGDPIRLTYSSFAAADSPISEAFAELADKLEEQTNGRVTIEQFHSGALCAFDEMHDCLRDGRTDIAIFLPVQSAADFPLSSVSSVLFTTTDTWAHSEAFSELAETDADLQAEWEAQGIVPLYFFSIGPAVFGTTEEVTGLDWLDGKSVRSTGYFTDALDVVGANPVAMPNADVYESIQRGVIDAFYASTLDGAAIDNSHFEVTTHWYDFAAGEYTTLATGMSQSAYDQLTAEDQQVLLDLVGDLRETYIEEYYLPALDEACTRALEGGVEVFGSLSDADKERFAELAAEPIRQRWIDDTSATGVDAEAFFDTFIDKVREKEAESPLELNAIERCIENAGS